MSADEKARERILKAVIDLMLKSGGNELGRAGFTFRDIAAQAGVSLGLINYHFESRRSLIRDAVRWHIESEVIAKYEPAAPAGGGASKAEALAGIIQGPVDYIMSSPGLARISILNDLEYPDASDNTAATWDGLYRSLSRLLNGVPGRKHKLAVWAAVGSIHEAFLRPEHFKEISGFDLLKKKDRKAYAAELAEMLLA